MGMFAGLGVGRPPTAPTRPDYDAIHGRMPSPAEFRAAWSLQGTRAAGAPQVPNPNPSTSTLVAIFRDSDEWNQIGSLWEVGGMQRSAIRSIERVQHQALWSGFDSYSQIVASKAINQGDANVKWMWHGGRGNDDSILRVGLEPQFGNSRPYGVWLHHQSAYSCNGYSSRNPEGFRSVFLVCATTGTHGRDDGSGRRAIPFATQAAVVAEGVNMNLGGRHHAVSRVHGFRHAMGPTTMGQPSELADCHAFSQPSTADGRIVLYRGDQCYPAYKVTFN